jgi:hypothetical protein
MKTSALLVALALCGCEDSQAIQPFRGIVAARGQANSARAYVYSADCKCIEWVNLPLYWLKLTRDRSHGLRITRQVYVPDDIYYEAEVGDFVDLRRDPPLVVPGPPAAEKQEAQAEKAEKAVPCVEYIRVDGEMLHRPCTEEVTDGDEDGALRICVVDNDGKCVE